MHGHPCDPSQNGSTEKRIVRRYSVLLMRLLTEEEKDRYREQLERQQEQIRAMGIAHMQQLVVRIAENDSGVKTFSCIHSTKLNGRATAPVDDTLVGRLAAALRGNTHVLHLELANLYINDVPGHGTTLTERGVSMLEAVIPTCAVEFVDLPRTISPVRRTAVAALGLANICASIAADAPRYCELDLSSVGLSDDALGLLAKALPGNTQVERVILRSSCGPPHAPSPTFTGAGLELLQSSIPKCAVNNVALDTVDGVSADARAALLRAWVPKLASWIELNDPLSEQLDLCDCGLDDSALGQIARALRLNTHITSIDLSEGNDLITGDGLAVLAARIPACRVKSVIAPHYDSDWVGQESCDANARASDIERVRENDPSLTIVDWTGGWGGSPSGCSDGTMAVLVDALRGNTHVRELRIGYGRDDGMTDAGAALLLDAIPHTVIERADVSARAVSVEFTGSRGWGEEKGMIAQACLKNLFARRIATNDPTLTALDLSERGITTSTACSLASALDGNTCLRTIDLSLNPRIGVAGIQAIQTTLSRSAVQQVSLICSDGSVPLAKSIANLGSLGLDKLGKAAEAIGSICARNEAVAESIAAHRPLQLLLLGAMISRGQDSKVTHPALVNTHLPVTFGVVEAKIREHLTTCRVCPDVPRTATGTQLPLVRVVGKQFEWHAYQEGRRARDGKSLEETAGCQPPSKRARVEQVSD